MAIVRPFRGLRYNPAEVGAIGDALAPPFDVIDEAQRAALVARHPYNVAVLTVGRRPLTNEVPESRYAEAARDMQTWLAEQVLVPDEQPAFYVYEQTFRMPGENWAVPRARRGLIAAVKLERYEQGVVHPHEHTMTGPKNDRLRLMRACQASAEPVMAMYDDHEAGVDDVMARLPCQDALWQVATEGEVTHRFWQVTDPELSAAMAEALADTKLVIADGHHRYETALAYRDEMRRRHGVLSEAPWEYALMFLGNVAAGAMTVLPCHRVLEQVPDGDVAAALARLRQICDFSSVSISGPDTRVRLVVHDVVRRLAAASSVRPAFGVYWGQGHGAIVTLKRSVDEQQVLRAHSRAYRRLAVVVLHRLLIEQAIGCEGELAEAGRNILFTEDGVEVVRWVDEGQAHLGLLVPPTKVEQVVRLALAGQRLPHKATFFYPKLLSGTVFLDLRPEATIASPS